MSHTISEVLNVNRESRRPFGLKAEKTLHRVTFNPSTANPGETLYVHIPKLSNDVVYVPGSIGLLFNVVLPTSDRKKVLVNNVGRVLGSRVRVFYGGETLQDTNRMDIYKTYGDLFLLKRERDGMFKEGISSFTLRAHRSGAASLITPDLQDKSNEAIVAAVYGNRYRMALDHPILDSHGVFYARKLSNNITFEITLPESKGLILAADNKAPENYKLSNIELEYECITSDYLAMEATNVYQMGKGFYYENVLLHKTFKFNNETDTVLNEHINIPRRSMTGILCVFKRENDKPFNAIDSEEFINPNITRVNINVDGMPNKVYSKGMMQSDFWSSITSRYGETDNITFKDFYLNKFALWIDLRTYHDDDVHGNGLRLDSTKDGVKLEMQRNNRVVGGGYVITCYMYVVADALMQVENCDLSGIMY